MKVINNLLYGNDGKQVPFKPSPNIEEWKDIKGYEDKYQVSNRGQIRNIGYVDSLGRYQRPKVLKQGVKDNGYRHIMIMSKSKAMYIHRLVLEYFGENPKNLPCVNHIDGNKSNNHISNLEWISYSDNQMHSKRNLGNYPHPVLDTQTGVYYSNICECYEFSSINLSYGSLKSMLNGRRKNYTQYISK